MGFEGRSGFRTVVPNRDMAAAVSVGECESACHTLHIGWSETLHGARTRPGWEVAIPRARPRSRPGTAGRLENRTEETSPASPPVESYGDRGGRARLSEGADLRRTVRAWRS